MKSAAYFSGWFNALHIYRLKNFKAVAARRLAVTGRFRRVDWRAVGFITALTNYRLIVFAKAYCHTFMPRFHCDRAFMITVLAVYFQTFTFELRLFWSEGEKNAPHEAADIISTVRVWKFPFVCYLLAAKQNIWPILCYHYFRFHLPPFYPLASAAWFSMAWCRYLNTAECSHYRWRDWWYYRSRQGVTAILARAFLMIICHQCRWRAYFRFAYFQHDVENDTASPSHAFRSRSLATSLIFIIWWAFFEIKSPRAAHQRLMMPQASRMHAPPERFRLPSHMPGFIRRIYCAHDGRLRFAFTIFSLSGSPLSHDIYRITYICDYFSCRQGRRPLIFCDVVLSSGCQSRRRSQLSSKMSISTWPLPRTREMACRSWYRDTISWFTTLSPWLCKMSDRARSNY